MSELPRDYDLNFDGANELENQGQRAKVIIERLAANLAANDVNLPPDGRDIVSHSHVQTAAELLFSPTRSAPAAMSGSPRDVFVSFSHEDEVFIAELVTKLEEVGVTCFKADRDIRLASEWAESLLDAIRQCRVVVSILTPRFLESRWLDFEAGAAKAIQKPLVPVLRYVDRSQIPESLRSFQSMVVESQAQLEQLVSKVKTMCE